MVDGDGPSHEVPPRGVPPLEEVPSREVQGSAFVLAAGVPYVRGWSAAESAAELLRRELRRWGIDARMLVRADVTAAGVGVVELGWVSPEVAELLAALLAQAREHRAVPASVGGRPPKAA